MLYQPIEKCRSCGSTDLGQALDLGFFHLSDFKDSPDAFTDKAPLELVRCANCSLVQLRHTVDRDRLYKQYWYRSGVQPAMVSALRDVVREAATCVALQPGDTVVDIGANDGTLLRMYPPEVVRFAFEPAENLWPLLIGDDQPWNPTAIRGVYGYFPQVINGYVVAGFDAKIITSIACFYDVDDPNQFVEGIKANLHKDGVWINQLAYLPDTLKTNNFGDICHEHLTYWTVTSFAHLLRRHGLMIEDWSRNDVNGGSIRFVVRHGTARIPNGWADDFGLIALRQFALRIYQQRSRVRTFLHEAARDGKTVIGYGASTKASTYLQYWGVDERLLPFIADRNPDKFGKYTPTGQKVISEEEARAMNPDYFLALPWHFLDAFVEREQAFLERGGKFAVPFPELHFVGASQEANPVIERAGNIGVAL